MNTDYKNTITGLPNHNNTLACGVTAYNSNESYDISLTRTARIRSDGENAIFDPSIVNKFIETDCSNINCFYKNINDYRKEVMKRENIWRHKKQLAFPNINLNMRISAILVEEHW